MPLSDPLALSSNAAGCATGSGVAVSHTEKVCAEASPQPSTPVRPSSNNNPDPAPAPAPAPTRAPATTSLASELATNPTIRSPLPPHLLPLIEEPVPPSDPSYERSSSRFRDALSFLKDSYDMISDDTTSNGIRWSADGRSFQIVDKKALEPHLPRYFKLTKVRSFVRQLHMYGFKKVGGESKVLAYAHPLFLCGRPQLLPFIKRKPTKRGASHKQKAKARSPVPAPSGSATATATTTATAAASAAANSHAAETIQALQRDREHLSSVVRELTASHNTLASRMQHLVSENATLRSTVSMITHTQQQLQENLTAVLMVLQGENILSGSKRSRDDLDLDQDLDSRSGMQPKRQCLLDHAPAHAHAHAHAPVAPFTATGDALDAHLASLDAQLCEMDTDTSQKIVRGHLEDVGLSATVPDAWQSELFC